MKTRFFAALPLAVLALSASAANINPTWKISASSGTGSSTYTWFANDNNCRGMGYNAATQHLLVPSRTGSNTVHIVSTADGSDLGSMTGTFTGGGGNVLNKVVVTTDGLVLAVNLDLAATFKIYKASSEASSFTAVYDQATANSTDTAREGDDIAVRRLSSTNLELLVPTGTSGLVRVYSSTDNGDSWTMNSFTVASITTSSSPAVDWDPSLNRFYIRSAANANLYAVDYASGAGTLAQTYAEGTTAREPFGVRTDSNSSTDRIVDFGIGTSTAGSNPSAFSRKVATGANTIGSTIDSYTNISAGNLSGGTNVANTNASGDVIPVGNDVYILFTNNAITKISGVSLPVSISAFAIE
jgi:hypothetical protein